MFRQKTAESMRATGDNRGFSLIEVLIALAIFSVGMLGVGALQLNSASSNTGARLHTEATTLLVDQIERLTGLSYDDADLDAGSHAVDGIPYTVSWTVVDDAPAAGAKTIAVSVTGAHPRARPITISFIKGS